MSWQLYRGEPGDKSWRARMPAIRGEAAEAEAPTARTLLTRILEATILMLGKRKCLKREAG